MCVFCGVTDFVIENDLAGAFYDRFPVSKGHLLIIPKKHKMDYFDLSIAEKGAIDELLKVAKKIVEESYRPDGFNIGTNCGINAGQSIMHCHIHLIPRYIGDMTNPKGGVRGVIPSKQQY
ncbi:diadenosine tetraphosphate (Ap4A) HIT family hydrolase [Enterococcus rotai]|uniref:Diadenosine tetraphosphate hydrolase n=1 Tax=Enterococcus rotai TaxID=118060 RepID=A0A0U2VHW8_9ENTE|nr:HIT family protein [Enterococcus rotai]ALS37212.1 diadenosine tetraphosphate hydrolase [Enterococcus rotai]